MAMPKVSIIVPCYKQAHYLDEALQSVLDQTYGNWECIIVNDGSPDHTEEIATKWVAKDSRFIYLYKENGGLSSARNAGLDLATGDYLQFLDADDILLPKKLEKSIQLSFDKAVDVVVSNFLMFTDVVTKTSPAFCELKEEYLSKENVLNHWDHLFSIPIHCGFFKRLFFTEIRFPQELKAKEDWIMWILLFSHNPLKLYCSEVLCLYRLHHSSMTKDRKLMQTNFHMAVLHLKKIVSEKEFDHFLLLTMERLSEKATINANKNQQIKESNSYKLGRKIRFYLKKMGLLHFSKRLLRIV